MNLFHEGVFYALDLVSLVPSLILSSQRNFQ
ncbi:hypothetical protein G9444_1674 [Rhodococcus erythropolis]|uniref:Uncharacterized protein n=1 Tax=Rhodococcus erythropolis TaxID=1833 RepID=A0A6G9CPU9_RHOER|nr:hypothetical protein N806_24060 [Rhodococcus sp. P27]QIP38918.1 hypothetical protein G9444_1674 [Rhodococcus erythropolis]